MTKMDLKVSVSVENSKYTLRQHFSQQKQIFFLFSPKWVHLKMRFPIVVWTVKAEVFKNLPHHPNSLSGLVYAKWTSRPVSSVFHSSVSPSRSPSLTCSLHLFPFFG